jgi:hypothetical protein
VHLAREQGQKPLAIIITAEQRGDAPRFTTVMDGMRVPAPAARGPAPGRAGCWPTMRTPRGRSAGGCAGTGPGHDPGARDQAGRRARRGSARGDPPFGKVIYRDRHAVERWISRLKRNRVAAARYGATVQVAMLGEWAVTSAPVPSWDALPQHPRGARAMHCTAVTETETGDYIDDPTEAQLEDLIVGLGQATETFVTIGPADETQDWYASVSLLADGTTMDSTAW